MYPNSGRIYPSLGYESAALADLCYELYGISRVILVTTADIYGDDAVDVWNWRAQDYDFQTIGHINLVPGGLSTDETQAALTRAIGDIAGRNTDSQYPFPYPHQIHPLIPFIPSSPYSGGWKNMDTFIRRYSSRSKLLESRSKRTQHKYLFAR